MAFAKPKMRFARFQPPRLLAGVAGLLLFIAALLPALASGPAQAAAGINQQINFQGRLLNSSDVPMADGSYNAEFKIYSGGDGQSTADATPAGSPGTLLWTEDHLNANSQGVQLFNGYFSIQLGSITSLSGLDFNSDTLWISINFGNTNATCTPFTGCAGDGEMLPMKRLSAQAYAFNSLQLGGLTASQFGQLAANQTFTGTNLFKTASANALQVQNAGGNSVLNVDTSGGLVTFGQASALNGQIVFANSANANTVSIQTGTTAGSYTLTLPASAATSNYCLKAGTVSGSTVPLAWGSCVGGTYLNKNAADTSSAAYTGTLYGFTNTDTGASGVLSLTNAGTGSALSVTDSGNPSAGNAVIAANNTNAAPSGNLLDLQTGGTSKFSVDYQGNVKTGLSTTTGTAMVCQNSSSVLSSCDSGFLNPTAGNFIKNTTTVQANANLYVRSAAIGSAAAVLEGASGQTADLLDLNTYNGATSTTAAKFTAAGNLVVAATGNSSFAGNLGIANTSPGNHLAINSPVTADAAAQALIYTGAAGNKGLVLQGASAQSGNLLGFQDSNGNVLSRFNGSGQLTLGTIGALAGGASATQGQLTFGDGTADGFGATLQTNGAITANRTIYLPDEAGTICLRNSSNCGFVSGSGGANFINNSTAVQAGANFYIRSAAAGSAGGVIEGASGQTADLLDLNSYNGTSSSTLAKFTAAGNLAFNQAATISTAAGNLTIQAAAALALGNSASTSVSIQPAAAGTVSIATVNANTVSIGSTNAATVVTVLGGGGINIGTGNSANTIQIGNIANAVAQTIGIGNNGTAGSTSSVTIGNLNGTSSTTIQSGTGNINLTTNQTGSGTIVKTATNNSTGAFQVQNAAGQRVLGVDTTTNQILVGQSSAVNGALVFKNSANTNGITINSTSATTNYTLTLPAASPAAGLCLETSTGSATQLVFASCANNNTSISQVQEWDANNTNAVTVSPGAVGDEFVLTTQIPTGGVTVTGISGGGVSNWSKVVASVGNGTVNRVEMWVGTITAVGSSTITVTYSAAPGAVEITATEFTAAGVNASTSWGVESSNSQLNSVASSTVTFPNATAVNGSELYVGYGQVQNPPATAGSTAGFNYIITSTQHNVLTYNTSLSANTAYQPTANQNSAGQSNTVAAVLTAFVTSTSINNTTSLQKANFYVQAASGGTVAGVLQAASTGTSDIMDLRDSSATNVVMVGNTGQATFRNSSNLSSGFMVQNAGGTTLLGVNTASNTVFLGTSSSQGGSLTFNNAANANTITLAAPTTVAASYTLSLPSNTPTAGLCLGTSPSNATQLIFASCATQVSAAAITYVNQWSASGTSVTTLGDSPASTGNLLILYSHATNNVNITGISGGGVTNWTKVTSNIGGSGQGNNEMWRGVVTSTGAATITVTYSAAAGANEITAQEFTMGGSGGTWAVDTSGATTGTTATVNYPSLTPANSSELYTGYAWSQNTMSAGTTAGYTYVATNGGKYTAYDTSVTGGTAQQPTATQSAAGNYNSIAALIQAYAGTSVIVNSTATQQANFAVQAATAGTVAGVLQGASSGSADIFQAKDGAGHNIAAVNASNGLTLGASNSVGGQLNFASSGNSNIISINAPLAPGSSYNLTLPTTTPAAGQCLATSPSNANQLVFSSCANQVTSVAISYVNGWKTSGNAVTTLPVSPANVGDLLVLVSSPNSSASLASVSGGGVSGWTKITGITTGSGSATSSIEMWRGQVTSTGASTITVSFNSPSGNPNELAAMEFTTGSSTGSWVVDSSNAQYNSTSSTTVNYPNLTPQSTKDLYVGYASAQSAQSAGTTTGFNYLAGSLTSREGLYNTAVSAGVAPTSTQATAGTSISIGALIAAYSSSSVIANSTITQQGNFNVQAATDGSVAGVLQAYPTGTGNIFNLLDGQGNQVDSFGSTGNFLVKPSTSSASAMQVQTPGGVNVLAVDTSGKQVRVGAGSAGENSPSLLVLDNETGTSADPTVLNGAMYYNATTHAFRCGVDGGWQNCDGLLYANTSSSSVNNNCSGNCAAFSTAAAIPANYCQTGRVIKLHTGGFFSSQATASNLQFGVYYGTDGAVAANDTLLGTLSPAASVTSASSNYFELNFNVLCFSTSTMQAGGILSIQTGSSASGLTALPMGTSSGTTVVTSSAKNLYVFPIWDTASTSNTATMTQFEVSGL